MSEIRLECQGLPCPQPVLKCKNAIEKSRPTQLIAVVDNDAAKENVSRFLTMQGYACTTETNGSEFVITAVEKTGDTADCAPCVSAPSSAGSQKILVFLGADVVGSGDDVLGGRLMTSFLLTLKEMGNDLWRIVMLNGGVRLSVEGNACLKAIRDLETTGVSVLVCGTCLEHFGLSGKNEVGQVTNMLDIVTSFQLATKVIRV
ncbi:MAG: sulfurtransferase-like selenium metabolism protein YedF [Pseudodesulfovibrio sp.]